MSNFQDIEILTATIASGQSLSSAISLGNKSLVGLRFNDANLDAISVSFTGSIDGTTFVKVLDSANNELIYTVGTRLLSLVLNAPGTVYAPADTVTLTGGVTTTSPVMTVSTVKLVSATIHAASGGTGYGNALTFDVTVAGGTKTVASVVNVTSNVSGVVTTVNSVTTAGSYTLLPTLTSNAVTGGSGTGLLLDLVYGINTFAITTSGVFTTEATTFTQASSSGSGTGATFKTPVYGSLPVFMLIDPTVHRGFNSLKIRAGTSSAAQTQAVTSHVDLIVRGIFV